MVVIYEVDHVDIPDQLNIRTNYIVVQIIPQ
jgi:hypothetical protein